jgi:hypothetical protein
MAFATAGNGINNAISNPSQIANDFFIVRMTSAAPVVYGIIARQQGFPRGVESDFHMGIRQGSHIGWSARLGASFVQRGTRSIEWIAKRTELIQ